MYRNLFLCFCGVLIATTGITQSVSSDNLRQDSGKLYVRLAPLGLVDMFDGNITVGAEYRITPSFSVTADAGNIFYSIYYENASKGRGWLFRPGFRVYPTIYKDFYVEAQFHYKRVDYYMEDWIDKGVVNNVPAYQEYTNFRYRKQVMGARVMAGIKQYLTRNHRFFVEAFAGIGVLFKHEFILNEPRSNYEPPFAMGARDRGRLGDNGQWIPADGKIVTPAFPVGIRFSYRIF